MYPLVYSFGNGVSEGDPARTDLLGGKGASLAAMSRAGFPVPPGFTISSECCTFAEQNGGRWPDGLEAAVRSALAILEGATGRTFGRGPRPLLVAVRSGAGVSMPGMMDTILNCGLNPALVEEQSKAAGTLRVPSAPSGVANGLNRDAAAWENSRKYEKYESGDRSPHSTWKAYAEHIRMFAASVAGLKLAEHNGDDWRRTALDGIAEYERHTGRPFPTEPWEALKQCIDAVFASWNSERARAYRQHHDIRGVKGTAVNVQMMFPSERSGVLFTANPQNPDAGEMILEASWGLGEAVVSGAVTPDIYVIDSSTLTLRNTIAGDRPESRPALVESEIRELAELGRKVESHFNVPSDIEWGIADGRVALLQTRAIRGLDVLRAAEELRLSEIARLKALAGDRHVVWVVHNLGETLPHPTPLTWDIIRWFMSGDGGFGLMYRKLGFSPSRAVREDGFLELIAGRIYVDPIRAAGLFWGTLPYEYDAAAILADRQTLERPPTKLNLERADPFLFLKLPGLVWSMLRSSRLMRRRRLKVAGTLRAPSAATIAGASESNPVHSPYEKDEEYESGDRSPHSKVPAAEAFESEALPRLKALLAASQAADLTSLSVSALRDELDRRIEFVLGEFAAESLLPGFFGGIARDELQQWLSQVLGSKSGEDLTARLTTGLEGDITVEQNVRLYEAARGANGEASSSHPESRLAGFLLQFGHRAAEEMELSQPRWREDPAFLERMLASFRSPAAISPAERHESQAAIRRKAEAELPAVLEEHGASSLRERIETMLREAQELLPYRESGKYHLMRGYETIRLVLIELANRFQLGRDIFFLRRSELADLETRTEELRAVAAQRKKEWQAAQRLSVGDVIDSQNLEGFGKPAPRKAVAAGQLAARPIAPGSAKGPARIVRSPSEAGDLGVGYILVCPTTDPGWTPLFLNCRGLVVERGGVLSHGAIVARDFGIPAVVLEDATRLIPAGSTIEVDAVHGAVVLEHAVAQ